MQKNKEKDGKKAQVSIEYLLIIGFVTFIIIGILSIAFFYSGNIKDRIKMNQLTNCANKIISNSESVFYDGIPSKATIECYLPENIQDVEISDNDLIFTIQTNSGLNKISFSSKVPITGSITAFSGINKVKIEAQEDSVTIS